MAEVQSAVDAHTSLTRATAYIPDCFLDFEMFDYDLYNESDFESIFDQSEHGDEVHEEP